MVLLGLSILVASITFFCYRHPPSSWLFLSWLRKPSIQAMAKKQNDAVPTITGHDDPPEIKEAPPLPIITKAELDRKAMPPPPFKRPQPKPSSPTTPRGFPSSSTTTTPTVPTFNLSGGHEDDSHAVSLFPAANSIQRASGGVRGPPRLNPIPTLQPSSGLMSPPMRSPLPNRTPTSSSSASLAPPPTHNSIPSKPRKKVVLSPGHSPLDWARLSSNPTSNLRGLPPSTPYIRVPPSLLKQYTGRKGKDAWTVLGGKVYNITPYLAYHPGGVPELMKAAGRDGTRLFGEVHPWVNYEGMLENCLVGIAVEEGDVKEGNLEEMD